MSSHVIIHKIVLYYAYCVLYYAYFYMLILRQIKDKDIKQKTRMIIARLSHKIKYKLEYKRKVCIKGVYSYPLRNAFIVKGKRRNKLVVTHTYFISTSSVDKTQAKNIYITLIKIRILCVLTKDITIHTANTAYFIKKILTVYTHSMTI